MYNHSGDAIDLDSFCGNIISECEKTEEVLMNGWFPKITAVFTQNKKKPKGEKLKNFYKCASSLLSIQVGPFTIVHLDQGLGGKNEITFQGESQPPISLIFLL